MANVPDSKKCQSLINVLGAEMVAIRASVDRMATIRTLFQTVNPSVAGTALEGNINTLNNAFNALQAEVNKAVWSGLIAAIVPSHRNEAL